MMRTTAATIFGLALLAPFAGQAQTMPTYATRAPEQVQGTISAVTGKYTLTLNDARGFIDSITLRDGTVISPTGVSLAPGQSVTVSGNADGRTFDAIEIDVDPNSVSTTYSDQPDYYYSPYAGDAYPYYAVPYGYSPYGYYGYYGGIYGGYAPYYYGYGGYGCCAGGPSKYTGPNHRYGPAPPHNYPAP